MLERVTRRLKMPDCKYIQNCDQQALPNDEYCILHSRVDNKNENQFQQALDAYLRNQRSNYQHIVFPPAYSSIRRLFVNENKWQYKLDFSYSTFLGSSNFTEFNFNGGVSFAHATFNADASFRNCIFGSRTDFNNATFKGEAHFDHCTFQGPVQYFDAKFEKLARFGPTTSGLAILPTTFLDSVMFLNSTFADDAIFMSCEFKQKANFARTVFCGKAPFMGAEFWDEVTFHLVRFQKLASFAGAKFDKLASFRGGPNEPVFFDEVYLQSVLLARPNILRFTDVNLSRARFAGADVKLMEFDGVEWCRINRSRLGLYEETLIQKNKSELLSITDVEKLYRALKQNYEDRRDVARAGDFHIGEKEMRLRNPKTPTSLRVLLALAKGASGYGESWLRPSCCFLALWVCVSLLGLIYGFVEQDTNRQLSLRSLSDWAQALGFVFAGAFHLENRVHWFDPTTVANTISLWAGVVGPLLGALVVLGIRNKLKR
jgi:uncharacterized protein YjbI with pentapeptide repeats